MTSAPKPHPHDAGRSASSRAPRYPTRLALLVSVAAVIAGCKSSPAPTSAPAPAPSSAISPGAASAGASGATGGTPLNAPAGSGSSALSSPGLAPVRPSGARTPREYRLDAAGHLYLLNANRIFKGRMPPMLYAIGVLEVEVDRRGNIVSTHWLRAPRHAPEVVAEIERTVRRAAPYPAPERMGKVTYTDTWLWDKSGRFQLDTLTEGQD